MTCASFVQMVGISYSVMDALGPSTKVESYILKPFPYFSFISPCFKWFYFLVGPFNCFCSLIMVAVQKCLIFDLCKS